MRFLICASQQQQSELKQSILKGSDETIFSDKYSGINDSNGCSAIFILNEEALDLKELPDSIPVFINNVYETLSELKAPSNVVRINGWQGFLQREIWEIAGIVTEDVIRASAVLGKKLIRVKDEPGLVSATVISMIVNEAFFALKEGVSTRDEIDMAMKLATRYPYGPFEWGEKIGFGKIYQLLTRLSKENLRYTPSFNPEKPFE